MPARQGIAYLSVANRGGRETTLGRHANPALRVPTLELDDGRHLAESSAIIFHLAETGDPELIPTDPFARAQMLQWMFVQQ